MAANLSTADRAELDAGGKSPKAALWAALQLPGQCLTMLDHTDGGAPMGMFGVVATDDPMVGVVWALTTDRVRRHRVRFHKVARQWVEWANAVWPLLTNVIWAGNLGHLVWLRALGFTLLSEHTANGHLFYEFVRTRPCVIQHQSQSPRSPPPP
ncbi:DUF2833 domain-containing protein [Hyphomicrobium sp. xq]|uniref:DUF2833 domain-containing protein n=1 Tax=Hyphomicrobium album TaxID=2665159 RepID=A0A6I3KGU1_9HYPH|nr:phage protein Gp13 family protein [Hyphomicrobium album]MTD92882.1 DUF2833 domain-containing protein [Hyphomicrobium album]